MMTTMSSTRITMLTMKEAMKVTSSSSQITAIGNEKWHRKRRHNKMPPSRFLFTIFTVLATFGMSFVTSDTNITQDGQGKPAASNLLSNKVMAIKKELITPSNTATASTETATISSATVTTVLTSLSSLHASAGAISQATSRTSESKFSQIGISAAVNEVMVTPKTETTRTTSSGNAVVDAENKSISTIYPTTEKATIEVGTTKSAGATDTRTISSTTSILTMTMPELDNNFIESATTSSLLSSSSSLSSDEDDENSVFMPHPGADSLTKGFSIPTFLPPFPVFAAADLPAYRAAAAAAAAEAAAAEAAAASTTAPGHLFNEQHLYLDAYNVNGEVQQQLNQHSLRRNTSLPTMLNITAQMGNHAYMPCQIRRLSDKPVSWVRMRDEHIISVDESTFIADERFQAIYQEANDYTWSLQIKYVQAADEGWYECQMATEPKMSAKVYLEVVTPKTELIGDQSRFVKAGSKVALHCIVRGTLDPPKYIIWFRGKTKIPDSDDKSGWYTQIDRNIFGNVGDNQNTIGSLIIPFVRKEDSGNYTCQPANSAAVSVDLHVLSGEYSASAIMSGAPKMRCTALDGPGRRIFLLLLILLLVALQKT